jgi:hypothetical protein
MILCLGLSQTSNSHIQTTNNTRDLVSIQAANNGSHGADLFVNPLSNQIYVTIMKTQNDTLGI